MAKRSRHTHKYIYQRLSKFNLGWRCALEYCDHFLPRNVEDTIDGRMSLCWECDKPFRLDADAIKDAMPKCELHREGVLPVANEAGFTYEDYENMKLVLKINGLTSLAQLGAQKIAVMQTLGTLPQNIPDKYLNMSFADEEDQIEVHEPSNE